MREQLLEDLATALKLPGISARAPELARALLEADPSAGVSDANPATND